MFRLIWSSRALRDFAELLDYVGRENPENVPLVRDRILHAVSRLEFFSLGQPGPSDTFRLYVPKTSYFVVFRRSDAGDIKISALVHASRDWEQINWDRS